MKIKHESAKGFRPFALSVTVETLDELYNLFARLNMSNQDVVMACQKHGWGEDVKNAVYADKNQLFFELLKYLPEGSSIKK